MRIPRFHLDAELAPGQRLDLPAESARHAARVLRLHADDPIAVFDGRGAEHRAVIEMVSPTAVAVRVGEALGEQRESPLRLLLAQGIARGERMDLVVQKATELGVHGIQPLVTRRSEVRLDARRSARREAHWHAVSVAACEQSGRTRLPEVFPVREFAAWLDQLDDPFDTRLLLAPGATRPLARCPPPAGGAWLLVGPEGGLDGTEVDTARAAGFDAVALGPRTLRTETAALAVLTLAQGAWGDLGST